MEKRISLSLDKKIYDALEKYRRKHLGINRSRAIEVILAEKLGIKLKFGIKKKKKWWQFWK